MKTYKMEIVSFALLAGGILLKETGAAWFQLPGIALLWYLAAILPVGLPVLKEAWECIRAKDIFNEYTLMSMAAAGAFYIGEYPEGVAVMLFYAVGERLQDRAVSKARSNIRALLDMRPETVTVLRKSQSAVCDPRKVAVGEIIEVKSGERVSLDGVLLSQAACFNTSALTGESMPQQILKDGTVLAGMIPEGQAVRIKTSKPYNQSALSRILALVEKASDRKAPAELFIRKFARIYTPVVTGLAALIVLLPFLWSLSHPAFPFIFNEWFSRALVFLVISCPCALVVSIPLGYFGGIGAASRNGILFKGSNYLDAITKVDTVIFDKTGTLTRGVFEVREIHPAPGQSPDELVCLAASVESGSTHPIARAIVDYAKAKQIPFTPVTEVCETPGYGLQTELSGEQICIGNTRLLEKCGIAFPPELASQPETIVICASGNRYLGYLLLSDTLKEDAAEAIDELKKLKITNIQILSGDKQAIVSKLAWSLDITQAFGDLLPEAKAEHLETLRNDGKRRIAFVGDGINDAPVLALSDVGIAMGGLGSDAAIETADVVIQTDHPSKVATAIRIGLHTRRIVWQNISMAFGVKLLVLILGAGGLATLWEAVFADVGVALLAILNAVRIQRTLKKKK